MIFVNTQHYCPYEIKLFVYSDVSPSILLDKTLINTLGLAHKCYVLQQRLLLYFVM